MAEHPGTPRTPDPSEPSEPSEDDLSPAAFDGLGLGSLADDVRPSRAQWSAIVVAASERHGRARRPWLISAAAAVVLVAAITGLLVARSGPSRIAVGSGAPGGAAIDDLPVHLLPTYPYDIQTVAVQSNGATMLYEADGAVVTFGQYSVDRTDSNGPRTAEDLAALAVQEQASRVEAGRQGLVWVWCEQNTIGQDGDGNEIDTGAAADARWISDGVSYVLAAAYGPATCEDAITQITARATALRQVTRGEWRLFLDNHSAVTVPPGPLATMAPTTTTLLEDPPTDRAAAEEQISAAVAGLSDRDEQGAYVNLQDGADRSAEYLSMFEDGVRRSGAGEVGGPSTFTFRLTQATFDAPDRARIRFDGTGAFPTGTFTFPLEGTAVVQDGRWVLTYDTIATMVGRACMAPGGYADCPATTGNGNGTVRAVPAN